MLLLAATGLFIGVTLMLLGLLMLAPQVRVHQIRRASRGNYLFQAGGALSVLAVIAGSLTDYSETLANVGLLLGVVGLLAAGLVGHHESRQSQEEAERFAPLASVMGDMSRVSLPLLLASLVMLAVAR